MFVLQRRRVMLFFAATVSGILTGATAAWLLAGELNSGFQLVPCTAGAAWGASWGLFCALHLLVLRPALLRSAGPVPAYICEVLILAPLAYGTAILLGTSVFPGQEWAQRPLQHAGLWFTGLACLAFFAFIDAVGLLSPGTRRTAAPIHEGRILHGEGFMLAAGLCPPSGYTDKNDAEQQIRLTQLAQKLMFRYGAGLLGMHIRTSDSDLVIFIPGRSNPAKNSVFIILQRCMKHLSSHKSRYISEFGFVPKVSASLHFGSLVHSRPSPLSHEGIARSSDLAMCLLAEKEARNRPCSLWVSDTALNKIMLPKSFRVTGARPLKVREGMGASRMFFISCNGMD